VAESERTAEEREAARRERERRRSLPANGEPQAAPRPANETDEDECDGEHEVALGTRRVSHRDRPQRDRPGAKRTRPKRSSLGRALSVLAILLAAAVIWFVIELFQPFAGSPHGHATVTIPQHSTASQVGDILERNGVIASSFFFQIRATLAGERGDLRAGTYHLQLGMSYGSVLKILTTPPPPVKVSNLTIIEGRTRQQISALLREQGIRGSYLGATRHSPLLAPVHYGAPRDTPSLEGFLFPDTYQLRDPVQISALVSDQLQAFKHRFAKVKLGYARSKGMTPYDVLIIASIVQKEAGTPHDFPLVASVIYNRLAMHIPLGMDSTTRYEFNDYSKPLTESQLSARSPYNTRLNVGLTPTPIDNPGLAAIEAAAHPAGTNYLYFVVKPCGNGASVFTSTYSQFLVDQRQYYSARAGQGGKSPAHC
jgi:uncharacterized YceG family protein